MARTATRSIVPFTALALLLTACGGDGEAASGGGGGDDPGELVVAATGGTFNEVLMEACIGPFEEETGIDVTLASQDSTMGPVKAQVEAGNVEWDVVYLAGIDSALAVEDGLLEPIDYDVIDADNLREGSALEYRLASMYSASVPVWNSDMIEDVDGTEALFDLEKYPGQRAIRSSTPYGVLEIALMADGVAAEDLYPLDVDRAFAKLDEIKDQTVFYTANEQGIQLLSSGQAVIGIAPNGRAFAAAQDGLPLDYTFQNGVNFTDYWVVPKGAENTENAMQYLAYISQPECQEAVGNAMAYGGNNPAADDLYSAEHQEHMPTSPENREVLVDMDAEWWSQNLESVFERWQAWLVQ